MTKHNHQRLVALTVEGKKFHDPEERVLTEQEQYVANPKEETLRERVEISNASAVCMHIE